MPLSERSGSRIVLVMHFVIPSGAGKQHLQTADFAPAPQLPCSNEMRGVGAFYLPI